jgi:hypothetical protein
MRGNIFIAHGDITQLAAHAIAYSTSTLLDTSGHLISSFQANIPAFVERYQQEAPKHRPCAVGHAFWIELPDGDKPHGVVVVASTGSRKPSQKEQAPLAVENALTHAVEHLRRLYPPGKTNERLLVALPAFRHGQGGIWDQELESARGQIRRAREVLDRPEMKGVDVAFITYTPQIYQTYLEARRREFGEPPCEVPALEKALCAGECVLFLGAGLSRGSGLPDWSELIKRLAADLGIAQPVEQLDYLDVAQWYVEDKRFGPAKLADMIRTTLGDPEGHARPTLAHYLLMSLPVRFMVTTNYDHLLERALTALRRYPLPIIRQEDVPRTGQREGIYVIKLHGDVGDAENLVLTRDAYDSFFQDRPALALLLEGLLLNETFFFAGYSLRDPNFRQIYARIGGMLREAKRPAFATILYPERGTGEYLKRQWHRKGLDLILFEENPDGPPEHQLLRFLDRLADRVVTQTSHLFLARDVEPQGLSEPLRHLQQDVLIDKVGERIQAGCLDPACASPEDVRYLAQVLAFLTFQGWRPARTSHVHLSDLWERLAQRCMDNPAERQRLLMIALRNTERKDDADRILGQLRELEPTGQAELRPPAILPEEEGRGGQSLL